MRSKSN
ncbi:hypothetical protein CP082626L3_1093A, partial [Chlamydia psittaci 08-2626_L3]